MKATHSFFWLMITIAIGLAGLGIVLGWEQFAASERANKLFAGVIRGSAKIETETHAPGEFDSIVIVYPATIVIQQGDKNLVTVEADDNLLPQLVTTVRNHALAIENSEGNYFKRVAPSQDVKITITVKELNEIVLARPGRVEVHGLETNELALSLKGASDIVLMDLKADTLNVYLSGGKVTAAGIAKNLSVSIGKSGEFDGADLQTLTANVQIGGTAAATLRVAEELSLSLSAVATVSYYGSPKIVHESISGTASIHRLGE